MARTVEDCALLLQALAGHDPLDPASSREPVADYATPLRQGIRGLRVGVPRAYFLEGVDAEVEKAFEQTLATLRELGAAVTDVEIPSIQTSWAFLAILKIGRASCRETVQLAERAKPENKPRTPSAL